MTPSNKIMRDEPAARRALGGLLSSRRFFGKTNTSFPTNMPKAVNPSFPLDGLFGLLKPSGPTSMYLLDRLKPLFRESSLFVPDDAQRQAYIEARKRGKVQRGKNKKFKDPVKMGQGGTLDPLADGVLGLFSLCLDPFSLSTQPLVSIYVRYPVLLKSSA